MKLVKFFTTIILSAILMCGYPAFRWYQYVTNTETPYDEVGITLNNYMPAPLNKWGCYQLKTNFGTQLPPHGCQGETAQQWK